MYDEMLMTCDRCETRHDGECEDAFYPSCPACGDPIDYCQGHGAIGDPAGYAILKRHDRGIHSRCHPAGCDALRESMRKEGSDWP